MPDTTAFIVAMRERVKRIVACYYEESPTQNAAFPYAVLNGIHVTALDDGDLIAFYIDVWVDENKPEATVELESLCDKLRAELEGEVVSADGVFMAHIGFENQGSLDEKEFDLSHRRLSMSARAFYYGGC